MPVHQKTSENLQIKVKKKIREFKQREIGIAKQATAGIRAGQYSEKDIKLCCRGRSDTH